MRIICSIKICLRVDFWLTKYAASNIIKPENCTNSESPEGVARMNLRELRISKNISQKQLAEQIGVTQAYICSLELGKRRNPSLEVIRGIARELGVHASRVLEALEEAV